MLIIFSLHAVYYAVKMSVELKEATGFMSARIYQSIWLSSSGYVARYSGGVSVPLRNDLRLHETIWKKKN